MIPGVTKSTWGIFFCMLLYDYCMMIYFSSGKSGNVKSSVAANFANVCFALASSFRPAVLVDDLAMAIDSSAISSASSFMVRTLFRLMTAFLSCWISASITLRICTVCNTSLYSRFVFPV